MTLKQWSEKTGILPTHPTTEMGAVSLTIGLNHPNRNELWDLEDFRPDYGGDNVVLWLLPRKERSNVCPTCGQET